jgi:hypothetical protein
VTPADFSVGEAVEVHSFGRWYPGVVRAVKRTRVEVEFRTCGGTRTRTKSVKPAGYDISMRDGTTVHGCLIRKVAAR